METCLHQSKVYITELLWDPAELLFRQETIIVSRNLANHAGNQTCPHLSAPVRREPDLADRYGQVRTDADRLSSGPNNVCQLRNTQIQTCPHLSQGVYRTLKTLKTLKSESLTLKTLKTLKKPIFS